MTSRALIFALFVLAGPGLAYSADRVTVVFAHPERFTDLRERCSDPPGSAPAVVEELARTIRETAAARLPAGFALEVTITDVDQAGEFEVWRGPQFCNTRALREVHAPRIDLGFVLKDAEGRVVREGQRRLVDQLYLAGSSQASPDALRYERSLLRDWLHRELPAPQ